MQRNDSIGDEKATPRFIYRSLIIGCVVVLLIIFGFELSNGSQLPFLVAIGLLAFIILISRPIVGIYIAYPLLFLLPYGALRLNVPFLNSPLDIVVSITLAIGIIHTLASKRKLPSSGLYIPMIICISILGVFSLVGHGVVANLRLMSFVQGLWPFALVILLLESPRQSRNILLSVTVTLVATSLALLPFLITGGRSGSAFIRNLPQYGPGNGSSIPYTLIQGSGALNALNLLTLLALALVAVFLFSICIFSGKSNFAHWFGFIIIAAVLITSTYASAMLAFFIGMIFVILLGYYLKVSRGRPLALISLLLLSIVLIAVIFYLSPIGGETAERLLNPSLDQSGNARIISMREGLRAFAASPIMGNGAFNSGTITTSGYYLGGHNTFFVAACEFGLVFLIPYLWLFIMIGKGYFKLMQRVKKPTEKAIAVGMAASFGAAVVTGFITPVFGLPGQDAIIWLFIGLMTVWNNWLDKNPEAELVA